MKTEIKDVKNSVFRAFILSTLVISPMQCSNADIVKHLYEAEAPVEGQSPEERNLVVRETLKEVLVRISGRNAAGELAADETLVPNPGRFVQQFRYKKFNSDETIPDVPEGAKPYTQKLWMLFTKRGLSRLLQEQGLPVWGKTRPATLVWLVTDDQKQRLLIGNNTPHISRTYIEQEAKIRGLPVRLPLLDLADQSKLQITDVWGNFEDTILTASQRYQTEAILVGRIYLNFAKTWHTRWTLYLAGRRQDWELANSETLSNAVKQGISRAGEILSLSFAQLKDPDVSNIVMIRIKNIINLKTYNQTIKYLSDLNIVSDIAPYKVNKEDVIFRVKSHSGRLGLAQAIALGHVLIADTGEPVLPPEVAGSVPQPLQSELVYKLVL